MAKLKRASDISFPFTGTDSLTNTIVAQTSEPTLRLELTYKEPIEPVRLERSIKKLVESNPVLGCRLDMNKKPKWVPVEKSNDYYLRIYSSKKDFNNFKSAPINIHNGPLLQCGIINKPDTSRIVIKIAHEAADGFGLKQSAYQIAHNYRNNIDKSTNKSLTPTYSRSPRILLSFIPLRHLFSLFFTYLRDKKDMFGGGGSVNVSHKIMPNTEPGYCSFDLEQSLVSHLRNKADAEHATLNDLLITAFLRAISYRSSFHNEASRISMTVNLRRYHNSADDLPIANLSSFESINLQNNPGASFSETLDKVVSITTKKKANWIGLGLLFDLAIQKPLPLTMRRKFHKRLIDSSISRKNTAFLLTNVGRIDIDRLYISGKPCNIELLGPVAFSPFWNTVVTEYEGALKFTAYMYSYPNRSSELIELWKSVKNDLIAYSGYKQSTIKTESEALA